MHLSDIIAAASKTEKAVVVFDDHCALCNTSIHFIVKHDSKDIFRFLGLSKTNLVKNSLVLIYKNKAYDKSTAVAKTFILLGVKWKILAYLLLIFPKKIRDYFYSYIAQNRTKWFGATKCLRDQSKILAKSL